MEKLKQLWVDKYAPKTLDEYVLSADLRTYFKNMINNQILQSMTFLGVQGSGKTSLVKVLCKAFNAETLFIPCATQGTIDIARTKIADFCNAMSFEGKQKIVICDEIDSASSQGDSSFQKSLRNIIESAQSDTRFLLTANYNKIIPAILSRCPIIPLKFDKRDLLQRVKFILDAEKIEYGKESVKAFIEEAFGFYPDCRRIINYLQFCCGSGKLVVKLNQVVDSDKSQFLEELMEKTLNEKNLLNVRQFYLKNKENVSDFVAFGSDIYNWAADRDLVTEDGILKLTDQLFQLNSVIDKEAGLFGMLTAVRKYRRS